MKLTKEEEALILQMRVKEEENEVKKIGYAKHDIYANDDEEIFSEEEMKKAIQEYTDSFHVVISKGDILDCFIINGEESWYDRDYGLSDLPATWAKDNLEKIKNIKKKSK